MELCTRGMNPWGERVVHILVHSCEGIPEDIKDKETYKILTLDKGTLFFKYEGKKKMVSAPAVFLLTEEEVSFSCEKDVLTTTVFFRPTEIREEFTPERIRAGEFEKDFGKTIHQDYLLLKNFENEVDRPCNILLPGVSAYEKISKIIKRMNEQLTLKNDGYWPCRSRSYMLELLSFISYACAVSIPNIVKERNDDTEAIGSLYSIYSDTKDMTGNEIVSDIIQYMSVHIEEKITQEDITKQFSVNRNTLNKMFVRETSMTWLNYLTKMRINLAQVMLAETELQIAEIACRVGYDDSNYFIKVFKKYTGVTPSKYRDSFW